VAKRIAITGATGFVGANLARWMAARGHDVRALVRKEHNPWRLDPLPAGVVLEEIDLLDEDSTSATLGRLRPDWIFHLAAYGAYSWEMDYRRSIRVNLEATSILLHAAGAAGVERFIHTGSSSEYGEASDRPTESAPLEPNSAYAVTKAAATMYVRYFARRHRIPACILRLYSVYGPYEEPRRLIPAVVLEGLSRQYPPFVDPSVSRDFVYVDDVCEAYNRAATLPIDPGSIFNVGSGTQTTIGGVARAAKEVFGIDHEPKWATIPRHDWDLDVWVADPSRIRAQLDWFARTSFEDGLRRTAQWLRSNPRLLEFYRECRIGGKEA
jgi:nucleoside-diphosphate-sugar epimerase